jgi:hypothetical protein
MEFGEIARECGVTPTSVTLFSGRSGPNFDPRAHYDAARRASSKKLLGKRTDTWLLNRI